MDDPRREGYLHQSGAAGLPTGSIRDIIPYVVFLSLHSDFSILSAILPQEMSAPMIKCKKTPKKKCRFMAEKRKKDRLLIGRKMFGKGVEK
jgi:hypothetical protein